MPKRSSHLNSGKGHEAKPGGHSLSLEEGDLHSGTGVCRTGVIKLKDEKGGDIWVHPAKSFFWRRSNTLTAMGRRDLCAPTEVLSFGGLGQSVLGGPQPFQQSIEKACNRKREHSLCGSRKVLEDSPPGACAHCCCFSEARSCLIFAAPWTAAHQASLSFTVPPSLLKLRSIESVVPSNHLTLWHPLLFLPSVFPSIRALLVAQMGNNLPAMQETWARSLGGKDALEKGMATHSGILAWEIHGQRSLAGYSPFGCKGSDTTERRTRMPTAGAWRLTKAQDTLLTAWGVILSPNQGFSSLAPLAFRTASLRDCPLWRHWPGAADCRA